jgi:hypothetical protein
VCGAMGHFPRTLTHAHRGGDDGGIPPSLRTPARICALRMSPAPGALRPADASHAALHDSSARRVSRDLLCGAVAGALAKTIIAPLDRTKIIFQTSNRKHFSWKGVGVEMRDIVSLEGVRGLWKGHTATMSRVVPYAAIQFASFGYLKRTVKASHNGADPAWWENLLAGAAAGALSVAATYPLDLMRARMAVDRRNGSLWGNLVRGYRAGGALPRPPHGGAC